MTARTVRRRAASSLHRSGHWRRWFVLWLAGMLLPLCAGAADQPRGLPFIRTYPLDEIGSVPRSLRLGFDTFGRVAVMYDGIYSVLNDSTWVDRLENTAQSRVRIATIVAADGKYYYGGRGSWGTAAPAEDGRLRAASLVPPDAPVWTSVTPFNKVLRTSDGLFFYELNGFVFVDLMRKTEVIREMPRLVSLFTVGERVFASCQDHVLREVDASSGEVRIVTATGLDGEIVGFAAPLDAGHTLLALENGQLVSFDGHLAEPWAPQATHQISGRITAMERLVDGGVAIALADKGIYIFSAGGTLRWSLLVPEFRRVGSLAAGEPGILWVAGENAVHRIFYDSPLTSFGQPLGLAAVWPRVASRDGSILVCSNGALYEMSPALPGHPPSFRIVAGAPTRQIDQIAALGTHLLAGTSSGVSAVSADGTFTPLITIENVAALEFLAPDTCIVFGSREIAALRYADGQWAECAERIPGVGDAPIHIEKQKLDTLWIEMGGDRVARLALHDGVLRLNYIALPWRDEQWTNVGIVGDIVVLTGASGQRAFYDDQLGALCAAPALEALLNRSPYWLLRVKADDAGTLWATHAQGVVTFTPQGSDYVVDSGTYELRNDSYPSVIILPGDDVWIAAGRALYHVEKRPPPVPPKPHAVLVSLIADHQNRDLLDEKGRSAVFPQFSFEDNSLSFRFFSGTYAWRFPPLYEYRLGRSEPWTPVDPNLVLRFPKLRDGAYLLEVRRAGPSDLGAPAFTLPFIINPPWYRTPVSYTLYALALLGSLLAAARWLNRQSLKHNAALERLVHERTRELEVTMGKLGEETKHAATLAERSRLAGEIHDSVQQGLSGTILHLETTMTHPLIPADVRTQLNIVRNMLSYSREEVQQAVWNLESPLLQNSTLGEALRKLTRYIPSGSIEIEIVTSAGPVDLDSTTQHHLLRIAQEAITNAVKHAEAHRIRVSLETRPGAVVLSVTDDGKGFDPVTRAYTDGHLGVRGLRSRAKSIHAELAITSAPAAGTTVQVIVPLQPRTSDELPSENQPT